MGVPIVYRKGQDTTSILYNYQDVISGTGYIDLYAGLTTGPNLLSNNSFYSNSIYTKSANTSSSGYAKMIDLDFDVVVNKPITIYGKALVNLSYGCDGGPAVNLGTYPISDLKYVRGGVETSIKSMSGATITGSDDKTEAIILDITSKTKLIKGDILRLTIEGYVKSDGANPSSMYLGHDPKGRAGWDASYYTYLILKLPTEVIE